MHNVFMRIVFPLINFQNFLFIQALLLLSPYPSFGHFASNAFSSTNQIRMYCKIFPHIFAQYLSIKCGHFSSPSLLSL